MSDFPPEYIGSTFEETELPHRLPGINLFFGHQNFNRFNRYPVLYAKYVSCHSGCVPVLLSQSPQIVTTQEVVTIFRVKS